MPLGQIGQEPNNSVLQGIIKNAEVEGITTSTWNTRSGGTSKTVFKGTQSQITSLAQAVQTDGWEYSITGGHIWTLEVTFPWDIITNANEGESNPLYTWELINQPFEKDIIELGDRPFNSNLSIPTIQQIEKVLKEPEGQEQPYLAVDLVNNGGADALNAQVAYQLKRIGIHGRQQIVQTLKRTMVVSNQYNLAYLLIKTIYDYQIFTKDQLLSTYNNNANVLNNIPSVITLSMPDQLSVQQYNQSSPQLVSGWCMDKKGIVTFIGWLQFPAEIQMVSLNKVQIVSKWTYNQWSAGPYGLYDPIAGNGPSPNPNLVLQIVS